MALFEFKLPDIGEGVTEGEIVAWLVAPGQTITEDEPMVEVMTDKATVTIAAPKSGRVLETRGEVGETVQVHSVLVVFELDEGTRLAAASTSHPPPASAKNGEKVAGNGTTKHKEDRAASAVGDIREDLPGMGLAPRRTGATPAALGAAYYNEKPLATPATRKLARDLGLDLRTVKPTGPFGRTTNEDVRGAGVGHTHAETSDVSGGAIEAPVERIEARRTGEGPAPVARRARETGALEERTPLKGLRKRIFENMTRSKQTAAHFTFVEECDVSALKELRQRLKEPAQKQGVNLTFLPFIVRAVVAALRRHPTLNGTFDDKTQEMVTKRYHNIGIATATDAGLVVPVVKNAGELSIVDLAREIERLAVDAREGKLKLEDITGSTFTITSLGQQGGLFATPIIHYPEVAILGVHQMKRKPVVRGDQIVIGDVMLLSLSFDHRLIDGHIGAAFAYELIGFLEQPETMFLDMI